MIVYCCACELWFDADLPRPEGGDKCENCGHRVPKEPYRRAVGPRRRHAAQIRKAGVCVDQCGNSLQIRRRPR